MSQAVTPRWLCSAYHFIKWNKESAGRTPSSRTLPASPSQHIATKRGENKQDVNLILQRHCTTHMTRQHLRQGQLCVIRTILAHLSALHTTAQTVSAPKAFLCPPSRLTLAFHSASFVSMSPASRVCSASCTPEQTPISRCTPIEHSAASHPPHNQSTLMHMHTR